MEESVALRAPAPQAVDPAPPVPDLCHGTVLWFSDTKGYGYIVAADGRHIFVRFSAIDTPGLFKSLDPGQSVSFRLEDDGHGPVAADVRSL